VGIPKTYSWDILTRVHGKGAMAEHVLLHKLAHQRLCLDVQVLEHFI
jgi:hypothetical protein